ncbi:MAG: DUF3006 domain-containing protein [Oscillospiraceae bacterium]|nr:DUF3006 domain-containing protein [Oscillospiraceae bacterium]
MSNILIVDRFEGGFALCEDEECKMQSIPRAMLPKNLRPGDCLRPDGEGYLVDADETARRRALNKSLFDQLKKREK